MTHPSYKPYPTPKETRITATRNEATARASESHLRALLTYGMGNGGLPNMTSEMCREQLRLMDRE